MSSAMPSASYRGRAFVGSPPARVDRRRADRRSRDRCRFGARMILLRLSPSPSRRALSEQWAEAFQFAASAASEAPWGASLNSGRVGMADHSPARSFSGSPFETVNRDCSSPLAKVAATRPSNMNVSSFSSSSSDLVCSAPMAETTTGKQADVSTKQGQIVHACS